MRDVIREFLSSTRAFQNCEAPVVKQALPHIQARGFASGGRILAAGKPAPYMGIIFSGRASVRSVNAVTGDSNVERELRVGDHFGDVAALLGSAQPREVVAEADCTVLLVPIKVFAWLTNNSRRFPLALAKSLASQLVRASLASIGQPNRPAAAPGAGPVASPRASDPPSQQAAAHHAPAVLDTDLTVPFVRTANFDITEQLLSMVPIESMLQHRFIPLRLDRNTLTVGMVDPHHAGAATELDRILHGVTVTVAAISQDDFMSTLVRLRIDAPRRRQQQPLSSEDISYEKDESDKEADAALTVIGNEVVHLVDKILTTGIDRGASDIHIEEQRSDMQIRFRINGMLHDYPEYIPASFARSLTARIKILAGLDITERRRPQDGRIGMRVARRDIDFRVSVLPASRGEKIVLRLFEASNMMRPLEQIFIEQNTLAAAREVLGRPYGAIIVAGPTGSGKSSTLYGCLNELRMTRPDTNICVVEDPIEYRLKGVTQVQVNYAVDLTFARCCERFSDRTPTS